MIDYQLLADSRKFYEEKGFQIIETPWTVTKEISELTKPEDIQDWTISEKGKVLVGSAEQGFLYLMNKGFLPDGKYQSIGPCFRNDKFTTTHTKYFLKNELILVGEHRFEELANIAKSFFESIRLEPVLINTSEGLDIHQNNSKNNPVEIGSYGHRSAMDMVWTYGTGLAEPRTSRLLNELS